MNERIKELAEQANEFARETIEYNRGDDFTEFTDRLYMVSREKFAELIIREYEKFLPDICPWADADKEGPMKGWHVQFVARKHFGVE